MHQNSYCGMLINRFKDLVSSQDQNLLSSNNFGTFPDSIGNFKLSKKIKSNKPFNMYYFAIYQDHNQKAFAKAWMSYKKNAGYYWLKNEIQILTAAKELGKNVAKNGFSIPKLLDIYEDKNRLIMLSEFIDNSKKKYSENELAELYADAISYLSSISDSMYRKISSKIIHIRPLEIYFSLPFISAKSLINRPRLWKEITYGTCYIYMNGWKLVHEKWSDLVHRDLRGSILKANNHKYIIDWQTAAFSHRFMDLSQLFLTYTENGKSPQFVHKMKTFAKIRSNSHDISIFKCISLYIALVEVSLVRVKTESDEQLFIKTMLNFPNI